jgi:hypothetical protein
MSFARQRLALGVANRLRVLPCSNTAPLSLVSYRYISTTLPRLHAEPINVKHEERFHGHRLDPPAFKSPHGTGTLTAENEAGKDVNPYKGGPSAIDKAVHLFFFTEIIRGAYVVNLKTLDRTDINTQACGLYWRIFFVRRIRSCIRMRKALFHPDFVGSMPSVVIPVVKSVVLVRSFPFDNFVPTF